MSTARGRHTGLHANRSVYACICLFAVLFGGCAADQPIETGPPGGWVTDTAHLRWWQAGVDTTGLFRNLDTLEDIGATGAYLENVQLDQMTNDMALRKLAVLVKKNLLPLFRNEPQVVDSLFDRFVFPRMASAQIHGDVTPEIEKFKAEGYRIIARHFRSPRPLTKMGTDIPVAIPDSLQTAEFTGSVFIQVAIDTTGHPLAMELLYGVHPVLDRIAMRATTKMRWQPAYLLGARRADAIPSWARFKVRFNSNLTP